MLRFFRQIRQHLFTDNKFSKYLLYAVGEILLVVIGILIALQVDDWANKKELKATEIQTYAVLLTSLRKDSLELVRIIDIQTKSLNAQNTILNSNAKELLNKHSNRDISELILDVYNGAYSFFPKYGTYNSLVSNKGIDLISSEKIKSDLIDLYDYWCPRYENVDEVSDEKFHNLLIPFLQREIGFFVPADSEITDIDPVRFEEAYAEFQLQCGNVNYLTTNSIGGLKNIQKRVNWLIEEIESQRIK